MDRTPAFGPPCGLHTGAAPAMPILRNPAAPPLSVAMSVYNAGPYVRQAIDSILNQTFGDFELLIVDDGSTDESPAIILDAAARDPRIRPILRENRGLVASLNQMLHLARAPWVARMDADDLCAPTRFARQMDFLAQNPDHGIIGTECATIGPDGAPLARPPIVRPTTHAGLIDALELRPTLNHNAVIYARALVLNAGGYRPAFAHAEDYDLWLRLSQVTRMANLADPLVSYRVYPGQVSDRHLITQAYNAGVAWLCHRARLDGWRDPVGNDSCLPQVDELDGIFGAGAAAYVRRRVIERALYAPDALTREAWDMLLTHAHDNPGDGRLWRLAGRILRAGQPLRAGRLSAALIGA
ncbi:glycosyltransferase [Novosphingobium sp. FSY-8]|uniref:Glycosyltransferase n=1 Tax=Novosphingobium ovatum TaxID=1908523 RepID=A0ABW9XAN9_9SPHN|nr:glycosyltransferase [Novosphingobium ovatum]NBC35590.1 glycosyltransferase [Novosphingobium ovatum]